MTQAEIEKPEAGHVPGVYGGEARHQHVKNLLTRSRTVTNGLTPEVIRRMRRHYQVISCLTVQSLPLLRAGWSIECEDDRIRDTLTEAYKSIAFHVHRSMTRALWAGYSPNALVWDYRDDLRLLFPVEVRDLAPESCRPLTDETGTLDGFEQTLLGNAEQIDQIYTLWIVEQLESGNYYGTSILDAALDPWQDYAAFRAFHARYLERFGEPTVLMRAPEGKSIANQVEIEQTAAANSAAGLHPGDEGYVEIPAPELVDNLDEAVRIGNSIRHHSVIALPTSYTYSAEGKALAPNWSVEYLTAPAGAGSDFLEAIRETDQRIARAMFVPDLLLNNTSAVGSNALGQSHRSTWSESVEGRLDDYSRQITAQVLDPARILAFGVGSPKARLVFSPLADESLAMWWSLVETLAADPGRLPVDVDEIAQKLGIPLLDQGDRPVPASDEELAAAVEGLVAKLTAQDPHVSPAHDTPRPDVAPFLKQHAATRLAGDDPLGNLPPWKAPQAAGDVGNYSRALNSREERVGFARLEAGMNTVEAAAIAQLDEILEAEHDRVLRQLRGILGKGTSAEILNALGTLEVKGGPATVKVWSDLMGAVAGDALDGLRSELATYASDLPDRPSPEVRALFRAYASTAAERALTSLSTEVRLSLLNGFTSGVSSTGLASLVGQVFDAYVRSEAKPVRLTTRMLSSKSLNYQRAAAVKSAGIPLAGAQYSAVLDLVTCDLCAELDEQVIPIESTDLSRFTPPVHHNCRCVWVWITREEADFAPTWSTPSRSKIDRYGGLVI